MSASLSPDYLRQEIRRAIRQSDPVLANLQITRVHYLLSRALRAVTSSAAAGANFHSWAVWGSRKAGVTIRQEDRESALKNASLVSGITGCVVGLGAAGVLMPRAMRRSGGGQTLAYLAGAARDWTRLQERMAYIVRLFRTLHQDEEVFAPPYSPQKMAAIERGEIPDGPL